jgi:hypothetical protein
MSLSVVEGGSKIKLTSGWKEFKFFLVVQLSRATALSQLPNFAVNEIACGGKQISRINLIFPSLFLLYMRDFLLWLSSLPFSVLYHRFILLWFLTEDVPQRESRGVLGI